MNNKIFYWSPFIDKVATVKSVINSAYSLAKYDKNYEPIILNTLGEWNDYKEDILKKNIKLINLTNSVILSKKKRKSGFLKSRILYLNIILKLFFPLIKFLKKNKDDYLIIHLITSLPLFLNIFFKKNNKIILRVSGLPKFTFFRKLLWNYGINYIKLVYCPTNDTCQNLQSLFPKNRSKFKVLRDPIINIKETQVKKKESNNFFKKKYYLSIGRLTKQKNYIFLLKFLKDHYKNIFFDEKFLIVGDGEEKEKLKNFIDKNNIGNLVELLGYKKNIFPLLKDAEALVSTSLWEDPGFTMIEAAYVNTQVISSNCPNGPKEILDHGKSGYIFETNSIESFSKIFNQFMNDSKKTKYDKKIKLKKISRDFTIFNHYKNLKKTINE